MSLKPFQAQQLAQPPPTSILQVALPHRVSGWPSPADWRNEVLYFLLPDRFSDGREEQRPLVHTADRWALRGEQWNWERWALSGRARYQGGTLQGIRSKLHYLKALGATTLWIGPVFKQRCHLDTYHGYGIQNFLDVDPRFGTRRDLVELVSDAHANGLRVLLDIIFNHSGSNWIYPADASGGPEMPHYTLHRHGFGAWRGGDGLPTPTIRSLEDGVWPIELQNPERYTRAGTGDLGQGYIGCDLAEHKRTDFFDLRDFDLASPGTLNILADIYKYWAALTDCDGFRIDTLKHVSLGDARAFCEQIKEFAHNIGKGNFFLVGEVAGGDYGADRYLDVLETRLNAALDISELRIELNEAALGRRRAGIYFRGFDPGNAVMGAHRHLGSRHVSILDDHDHVFGPKLRMAAFAAAPHQACVGVAMQLFTIGIPCIYYGTEQGFCGPEPSAHPHLIGWGTHDSYLREAMFGPLHPRRPGAAGIGDTVSAFDPDLPGFGPFGTSGAHAFDPTHPVFLRVAAMAALRSVIPALRHGRQYYRWEIDDTGAAVEPPAGGIIGWSRILDDEEILLAANSDGAAPRSAALIVDAVLNPPGTHFQAVLSTAESGGIPSPRHTVGSLYPVEHLPCGKAVVRIQHLEPGEVLALSSLPV
jgi:glycosidase